MLFVFWLRRSISTVLAVRHIEESARTWGVDLSTNPSNTGVVSIVWQQGKRGVFRRFPEKRRRDDLVTSIAGTAARDWWAVDVPFGWPKHWGQFLVRHGLEASELPGASNDPERPWRSVARRLTDLEVAGRSFGDERRPTPGFSVSFDKLGATAAAWAWVEWELKRKHDLVIDRSGVGEEVKVCETYPAAAWRAWSLPNNPSSIGTRGFRAALEQIVEPADGEWEMTGHERDAIVCALVARARQRGLTREPTLDQVEDARAEGWIHIQRDDVSLTAIA